MKCNVFLTIFRQWVIVSSTQSLLRWRDYVNANSVSTDASGICYDEMCNTGFIVIGVSSHCFDRSAPDQSFDVMYWVSYFLRRDCGQLLIDLFTALLYWRVSIVFVYLWTHSVSCWCHVFLDSLDIVECIMYCGNTGGKVTNISVGVMPLA